VGEIDEATLGRRLKVKMLGRVLLKSMLPQFERALSHYHASTMRGTFCDGA
jgi:hypothetical protein